MGSRIDLQHDLENFMTECGAVPHVYFRPPETLKLKYPCIVYHRQNIATTYANDMPYDAFRQYMLTVIDPDPDSEIAPKLAMKFQTIRYNRHFVADNLNHDAFTLYY